MENNVSDFVIFWIFVFVLSEVIIIIISVVDIIIRTVTITCYIIYVVLF